jgi:hypothetical protein
MSQGTCRRSRELSRVESRDVSDSRQRDDDEDDDDDVAGRGTLTNPSEVLFLTKPSEANACRSRSSLEFVC